ncbi:hypothetical protein WDV93_14040 [Pantoea ananatis]
MLLVGHGSQSANNAHAAASGLWCLLWPAPAK